jgi:hypothetical protein
VNPRLKFLLRGLFHQHITPIAGRNRAKLVPIHLRPDGKTASVFSPRNYIAGVK